MVENKIAEILVSDVLYLKHLDRLTKRQTKEALTFANPAYLEAKERGRVSNSKKASDIEPYIKFYFSDRKRKTLNVPKGCLEFVIRLLEENNQEYKIIDETIKPKIKHKIKFHGELRPYQKTAVRNCLKQNMGVVQAGTGAGKTVLALALIAKRQTKTLILVHSKELLYQWKDRIKTFLKTDCGLIGDSHFEIKDITVGIINSVRTNTDKLYNKFGFIITDECFPSGTLINTPKGKIPIEQIKLGNIVYSYNHKINKIEEKKVTNLFKNKPKTLCTIKLNNGKQITCTENHPFYTNYGYLTAGTIYGNISMQNIELFIINNEKEEVTNASKKDSYYSMCNLQKRSNLQNRKSFLQFFREVQKKRIYFMFSKMFKKTEQEIISKRRRKISQSIQQKICKRKNEREKSNVRQDSYRKNEVYKTSKWNFKCLDWEKRGKWTINSTTRKTCNSFRLENRSQNTNSKTYFKRGTCTLLQREKNSNLLQSGCRKQETENSNRNRWKQSLWRKEKTGQEENKNFRKERVESVEIHEPANRQRFKEMCKDDYVYNIEVKDNHNYFVNDVLVHNCHKVVVTSWADCITQFKHKYSLGLSATPFRRDGLGNAIYAYAGLRQATISAKKLIRKKAILKPEIKRINTEFYFFFKNNYQQMIKRLTESNIRNNLIIKNVIKDVLKRKQTALIVSDRVRHCKALQELLANQNIHSEILTGGVTSKQRKEIVRKLKSGELQIIISTVQLIGEGFDMPNLSTLHITTPIKYVGRIIQVVGRILRPSEGKKAVVYDYRDVKVEKLRWSGYARDRAYRDAWGE